MAVARCIVTFGTWPGWRAAAAALLCAALGACAAAPHAGSAATVPAAGDSAAPPDPALDWRRLMMAPFAATLKDLPFGVHEVLQFNDAARATAPGRGGAEECFRPDAAAPGFLGRDLEDYLLCFRGDRLERVEADLRLATDGVEATFDRYCDIWLKNTTRSARTGANCGGASGGIAFEARLDEDRSQTTTSMSVVLTQDLDDVP